VGGSSAGGAGGVAAGGAAGSAGAGSAGAGGGLQSGDSAPGAVVSCSSVDGPDSPSESFLKNRRLAIRKDSTKDSRTTTVLSRSPWCHA
jgi:hypothetical protein